MRKLLILVVLFSNVLAFSQNGKVLSDKEYYSLQEESRRLINANIDSSYILADKIEKSNKYLHKAFALGIKSYIFQIKGDSIQSKKNYAKAVFFLNKEKNSIEKLKIQSYLINFEGLSEWKRNNYLKSLDCFEKGEKISEEIKDTFQIIKFMGNKALIKSEIGEYNSAIKITKKVLSLIDRNINQYDEKQYYSNKSTNNLHLGWYFQKKYQNDVSKKNYLDSSFFYYEKAIFYSEYSLINRINAEKSIGINFLLKDEYDKALKLLKKTLVLINEDDGDYKAEVANINYNIGCCYYFKRKRLESLAYFKKVDSLYHSNKNKVHVVNYIGSNNYQAKIYLELGNLNEANKYSKIASEEYEKNTEYLANKKNELISRISSKELQNEMLAIQKKYRSEFILGTILKSIIILFVLVLVFLLVKTYRDKKRIIAKVNLLIEESKNERNKEETIKNSEIDKKTILISGEEEDEIVKKINLVNEKQLYLKQEFNQQYLAKKLKTNTTYLSYIFNKVYGKTFSVYYNELRLDFVINEIINNKKFREYSTQAIAESAGYKNADSFTISFKKKTGLTPFQFINEIKKREFI
ncbi:AraC family transcriptional regulator [Flavobacterium sp.]|uniref:helix-turn-helix domain-containing protein n=1 Tax=Flavobacterium sp. TaxID=239 RepID=UPI002618D7A2|nr:helix-turn-helix domain-containing protein [Flavobacterium sp.]